MDTLKNTLSSLIHQQNKVIVNRILDYVESYNNGIITADEVIAKVKDDLECLAEVRKDLIGG